MTSTFIKSSHVSLISGASETTAPEWIQILPAGTFTGRDGRGPYSCNPAVVVATTRALNGTVDIPMDYDHQIDLSAKNGTSAPAAAWITALEAREDGVWGKAEWTDKGQAHVASREYRYVSPVFYHAPDGTIRNIESVALTNLPNFTSMKALASVQHSEQEMHTPHIDKASHMIIDHSTLKSLYIGFSAAFAKGLGTAPSQYEKIAMIVPSSNRENTYPWLGALPSMRQWVGDRIVRNLKAYNYSIQNLTFETTIAVKSTDIEDDNFGLYGPMFTDLGQQAGIHPNKLVFGLLKKGHEKPCYDGKNFFDTEHPVGKKNVSNMLGNDSAEPWYLMCTTRPVKPLIFQKRREYELVRMDNPTDYSVFMRGEYLYGVDARVNAGFGLWQLAIRSTDPLSHDSYSEARAAMMSMTNDEGVPLGLMPNLLVVPPAHEGAARKIVLCEIGADGSTNMWYQSAEMLMSPWLV